MPWLIVAVLALALALSGCAGVPAPLPLSPVPANTVQPTTTATAEEPTPIPTPVAQETGATAPTAQVAAATASPAAERPTAEPSAAPEITPQATTPARAEPASSATSAQEASMREEIFLAGAPVFAAINRCPMPQNLSAGKRAATWTSTVDSGLLCLFGFGVNETVRYQVLDAAGEVAVTGEGTQDNLDGDALPSVKVKTGIGDRAPGRWMVKAAGPSGDLSAAFDVQAKTQEGKPAVVLALAGGQSQFKLGQSIGIAAYGLPDSAGPLLGVYSVLDTSSTGSNLRLHETTILESDTGAAFVTLTLDSGYEPGEYCLVLQASPEYEPAAAPSTLGATRCFEATK